MTPAVGPALRWVRGAVLAAVAMLFAVVAHAQAGGLLPGAGALLAMTLAGTLVAAALLGRPASTLRVVVLLVSGQTAVHGLLTLVAGHERTGHAASGAAGSPEAVPTSEADEQAAAAPDRAAGMTDLLAGTLDRPTPPVAELTLAAPVQHLLDDLTGESVWMALAHLAAAGAVGLWLAYGEHLLWRLVGLLARSGQGLVVSLRAALETLALAVGGGTVGPPPQPVPAVRRRRDRRPCTLLLSRCVVRRGPPVPLPA